MKNGRKLIATLVLSIVGASPMAAALWALPTAQAAEPAAHTPTLKETLTAVGQISHELKQIDGRLGRLEQSLAGVDASLKPVGSIAQPAAMRELILLATACGAGLIVLHALLHRWLLRAAASAGRGEPEPRPPA